MAIGAFFKALFGGEPPVPPPDATKPQPQKAPTWKHGMSDRRVAVICGSEEIRTDLAQRLKGRVEAAGYEYEDHPSAPVATGSEVVIVDGTPRTHAKLHAEYNKILRIKKSMGKQDDMYCVIGERKDYSKYPRGTYPSLRYFCVTEGDLLSREADLPAEGLETIEGPRLYNYADLPDVIEAWMKR